MHGTKQLKKAAILRIVAIVGALVCFASASRNARWSSFAILNSDPSVSSAVSSGTKQRSDEIFSRRNALEGKRSDSVKQSAVKNVFGGLPLSFEVNQGQ